MRHLQDTKPQMTAKQLRFEIRKAINLAIRDGVRQRREAAKRKEVVRALTTQSYINGLLVAKEILRAVGERI